MRWKGRKERIKGSEGEGVSPEAQSSRRRVEKRGIERRERRIEAQAVRLQQKERTRERR